MSTGKIVIRHQSSTGWTAVPHGLTEDSRLSWKSKALWTWLASRPEGWIVRLKHLTTQATDGIGSVRSGLQELESFGYIVRKQLRDDDGRFIAVEYTINSVPGVAKPHTENPHTDNRTLNNKKRNKKNRITPEMGAAYKELWSEYPSRGDHPNSYPAGLSAYQRLIDAGVEPDTVLLAVKRYSKYVEENTSDPQYVMSTARFLSSDWQGFAEEKESEFKTSSNGLKFL